MITQQLRFGAYWDAIPPFYCAQGVPPIPESNYTAHTDFEGLAPVQMPRDLVFKLLWQVRSVTIKLEYEFDPKNSDGWISSVGSLTTDQPMAIATRGPFTLTDFEFTAIIGSASWATRELKLPQGNLQYFGTEAYPTDRDAARELAREGFGIINPYITSDFADFNFEKDLVVPAIEAEAQLIKSRLAEIKALATGSNYTVLETEITRQETAFDSAVVALKNDYQAKVDLLVSEYNALTETEELKVFYGKKAQTLKNRGVFDVKQEASLQWFDWEGGFGRRLRFLDCGKYRIQAPQSLHNPPTIGGIFASIHQSSDQLSSLSSTCLATLKVPSFTFPEINFGYTKPFTYESLVQVEPEQTAPTTILLDSEFSAFTAADLLKIISTTENRAAAVKYSPSADGFIRSGYFYSENYNRAFFQYVYYSDLFNFYNETPFETPVSFPVPGDFPTQEIADVVLSGEYFGAGNWSAATAKFQELATKVEQLKEIGTATEAGTLEIRGKDDGLLFEAPLFVKDCVPIKNIRLTYKIDKLHTDPLDT